MSDNKGNIKSKHKAYERVFVVTESYMGKKNLSDIFADLLYSAYMKIKPKDKGGGFLQGGEVSNSYPPGKPGKKLYGGT